MVAVGRKTDSAWQRRNERADGMEGVGAVVAMSWLGRTGGEIPVEAICISSWKEGVVAANINGMGAFSWRSNK